MDDSDPRLIARATDPETSHQAAAEITDRLDGLRRWAADCVARSPGLTRGELARLYCGGDPHTIARRLTECDRLGTVRRGPVRRCSVTGRRAATWLPPVPGTLPFPAPARGGGVERTLAKLLRWLGEAKGCTELAGLTRDVEAALVRHNRKED